MAKGLDLRQYLTVNLRASARGLRFWRIGIIIWTYLIFEVQTVIYMITKKKPMDLIVEFKSNIKHDDT